MAFLILVPTAAEDNFEILLNQNIWGFQEKIADDVPIEPSTTLLFVHGVRFAGEGKAPSGFPRMKSWDGVPIRVDHLLFAEATSEYTDDELIFGPKYAKTFKISITERRSDIQVDGLPDEIIELIRLSTASSKPREFEDKLLEKI